MAEQCRRGRQAKIADDSKNNPANENKSNLHLCQHRFRRRPQFQCQSSIFSRFRRFADLPPSAPCKLLCILGILQRSWRDGSKNRRPGTLCGIHHNHASQRE